MQNKIAREVANRRKMSPEAWHIFTENAPAEVIIPNCTQVSEAHLVTGLQHCCTAKCVPLSPCSSCAAAPPAAQLQSCTAAQVRGSRPRLCCQHVLHRQVRSSMPLLLVTCCLLQRRDLIGNTRQ